MILFYSMVIINLLYNQSLTERKTEGQDSVQSRTWSWRPGWRQRLGSWEKKTFLHW